MRKSNREVIILSRDPQLREPLMRSVLKLSMQKSNQGFFLVIDGIDGSGKSTLVDLVTKYFHERDFSIFRTTEPTQRDLGQILRKYLRTPTSPAPLDALVFAADRIEHCTYEILPALKQGNLVISDRYRDSSYVYQTIQGKSHGMDLEWIKSINKFSIEPDLTIILDLDPKISLNRKHHQTQQNQTEMEKFENLGFQTKIRELFLNIAQQDANHVIFDATKTPEILYMELIQILKTKWSVLADLDL